ncbi:MAG TPA: N-6 DNA methylase, partial [Blastocatellia bacterium]|nr:N-6 DNA methylase [Blastocatellia bacterium]
SVRHDLGEYYTPDWLAEHVLNELGYVGDPDKRLLDPACGSGTFLVMAINRIKSWYEENRERCHYDEGDLCRKILSNVIGFDLNPLAVMAARTNYLIAIRDLISHVDKVEIPVYLCDSIMTPSEYGGLFGLGKAKEFKTAAASFLIPTEITTDREDVAKYAEQLEFCVRNGYAPDEFLERCRDEGLPINEDALHAGLYDELVRLDKANKNGVWARIIKNAFAPLFIGQVDYVAGNPPWVNWESLPGDYRDSQKPLWQEYGLFTLSGSAGRLGGGKKDLSMLFVYVAVDNYLHEGGGLGFVITQTVFKTKGAGDGFRRLRFARDGRSAVIKPLIVHDLSAMQVFEGATNRTAVFVCEKQKKDFAYPVPYHVWRGPARIAQEETITDVQEVTEIVELSAVPVEREKLTSPWLTLPSKAMEGVQKALGKSHYTAHAGAYTGGLNGCFWIRILHKLKDDYLLIENLHDVGKIKVEHVQTVIEPDLVYPLLRGRDVSRWYAEPSAHIILAQDPEARRGIPETEMKRKYPKTYAYLKKFEPQLRKRASSSVRRLMDSGAFYSMFAVGPYTMAPYKVVWREQSSQFQAAKIAPKDGKAVIPDHKLMAVSCSSENEADYLAALLGSAPCKLIVASYVISTSTSTHVLEHIAIPSFQAMNPIHKNLALLSKRCHEAAAEQDMDTVHSLEDEIDQLAANLWGIATSELKAIQNALRKTEGSRLRQERDIDGDE